MPKMEESCGCVIGGYDTDESEQSEKSPPPLNNSNGITVDELITYLQELKEKKKEIANYIIQHINMGALKKSTAVEVDSELKSVVVHSYY
jgi:hypothetical protein